LSESETEALLEMARELRHAFVRRDDALRPYRERYDRAEDDLRMGPEKRAEIARAYLRASCAWTTSTTIT
jgi:hypothetical protein